MFIPFLIETHLRLPEMDHFSTKTTLEIPLQGFAFHGNKNNNYAIASILESPLRLAGKFFQCAIAFLEKKCSR